LSLHADQASLGIDKQALDSFVAAYGPGPGATVAVVMAAFNESESVAAVVRSIPTIICGLRTETIVVDDGSTDDTSGPAREAGALVCRLPVNMGQGHALQLGYRLARQRAATFIATTDADGQFDARELPTLVAALVADEADFVNGSRRLGRAETNDSVRKLGLVLFGALVSLLTGVRITDPANGLRAFRAEVTEQVPLRQSQYQTSELLIGAIACGFRVKEVPVTVYPRRAGTSKKGTNLSTWWAGRSGVTRVRPRA
jgi:glycosyltransferase involved in cell wall biosynthesis